MTNTDDDKFKYVPKEDPAVQSDPKAIPVPSGYRKMSPEEFALFDTIGQLGNNAGQMVALVLARDNAHLSAKQKGERARWAAIARTDLQKGFMALKRAVFLPENF